MSFLQDSEETKSHPKIVAFLADCETVSRGAPLTLEQVQSPPLFRYSPTLIILRWDPDKEDFHYRYWGSQLSVVYGMDLTGGYIADGKHGYTEQAFIQAHLEVLREKKRLYLGGRIDWRDKDHQRWNQVIQPLARKGEIVETLTYVTFD
ncbi:hypothetical protein ACTL6U_16505 [Rhodovibrionaceae bacterium A322]